MMQANMNMQKYAKNSKEQKKFVFFFRQEDMVYKREGRIVVGQIRK